MPFYNANNLLYYARNYRVAYLGGRFGGGKTSLCFRMAWELVRMFKFRYILSNVKSVWNDDPEKVVLREGKFVDAIIILDEGGEFLDAAPEAKKWLYALRKINVILLIPSVIEPSRLLRRLTITRVMNGYTMGLPLWAYQIDLKVGSAITEKDRFVWTNPSEIFGIYDTVGMPTDADELLEYIRQWTAQAAKASGYEKTSEKIARQTIASTYSIEGFDSPGIGESVGVRLVEEIRGAVNEIYAAQEDTTEIISASSKQRGKRRR